MVAARRPAGFAKYLERLGHSVTVLTSRAWGRADAPAEPATRVIRTADLMDTGLNWRRAQLKAWSGGAPASPTGGADYATGVSWPARVLVPDVAVLTWLPFAYAAARRLARRDRFDCVITTSGPESIHLAGAALARGGLPWVADFRDGWGFESLHDWPTAPQWAADRRLERFVVTRADGVCAVTEPIAVDLRERFGVDAVTITNGYDPDDAERGEALAERPEAGTHTMLHAGRMASSQRSPAPVLEALRLLDRDSPAVAAKLRLAFAGPLTAEERSMLEGRDVADRVRLLGSVPRSEVLGRERAADSLLLLTAGARRGEATGKLYEYLSAGRPILVLGDRTEAARIVADADAGVAAPVDDPAAIAAALERLVRGNVTANGAPPEYGYPRLAERMAALVETARTRAAQRNRIR